MEVKSPDLCLVAGEEVCESSGDTLVRERSLNALLRHGVAVDR